STREGTARREPDTRGALAPIDLARGRLLPLSIRRRERAPDRDPGIRRGRRTTRGDRGSLLRGGEDGCGTLLEAELRKLDAEQLDLEVRAAREELALAAHARGADPRLLRKGIDGDRLAGAERIPRDLTRRDSDELEPGCELGGDVLHAVDREVGGALEERLLDLLDEQALAADLRERDVEDLVARGGDDVEVDGEVGRDGEEARLDVLGLPECEGGASGGDHDS